MKPFYSLTLFCSIALASCGGKNTENSDQTDTTNGDGVNNAGVIIEPVEFEAADSLLVSANLYEADKSYPMIVLCHQAGFCKYEYAGVAERLNGLGFNCLAIDQRSGGPLAENQNETWLRAIEQKKSTDYLEAEKDIEAAIDYAYEKSGKPVIILGSSYSSTLCVYEAIENDKVSAVIAFSPGNYFAPERGDLIEKLIKFEKPFFFTAAREEIPFVREIVLGRQRTENQIVFAPEGEGHHGARALWPNQQDGDEYWRALEDFLKKL